MLINSLILLVLYKYPNIAASRQKEEEEKDILGKKEKENSQIQLKLLIKFEEFQNGIFVIYFFI